MIPALSGTSRREAALCSAIILLVLGCAPLPPLEPFPAPRSKPRAPRVPYAEIPARQRSYGRPTPTPTHGGSALNEQEIGETADLPQAGVPPPDHFAPNDEPEPSLEPQIKAAKAPNVAAALRLVDQGRILIDQQQYEQALVQLQRAVSIDPSSFYGYYFLAKAHQATRDYSQGIAFANRATALGAQAERVWLARAYTLQGEIFEEVGRFPDARIAYQRAVDADPTNLEAYVGKARLSPPQPPTPAHEDSWR